jgi:hypothetical protein
MRSNPRLCVEVDEIRGSQQWTCVIVFGRYEELPHSPEWLQTREMVHSLLEQYGNWWDQVLHRQSLVGLCALWCRFSSAFSSNRSAVTKHHPAMTLLRQRSLHRSWADSGSS